MTGSITKQAHPQSPNGLENIGLKNHKKAYWNLNPAELYEEILQNGEGILTEDFAIRILTGKYTGRSPKDRFIVDQDSINGNIDWNDINKPIQEKVFDDLYEKVIAHLRKNKIYIMDMFAGAEQDHRLPLRIVSEAAYHALFSYNMFRRPSVDEMENHDPGFTVIAAPSFQANPEIDSTRSEAFIFLNFDRRIILIGGSMYSGEVKKGIFTVMNYLLPQKDVMPMHCSANIDEHGNSAIFFGLSGTGKTTLSADESKTLIGDDEHGWGENGVFNFEGGCYAKTINLSADEEPMIFATTEMPGTILENVVLDYDRKPDFEDTRYTQNTRCSYPLHYIENTKDDGKGDHPENVIFLTADAFGVLPPISKLTAEQAMYHFISGYTAKIPGTERGIDEPIATFSACFGAPFMPLHPTRYAKLLAQKIKKHNANVWLVNTGWTGGKYGEGHRIDLPYTRKMLREATAGHLDNVEYERDDVFGLAIPTHVDGVPDSILNPRNTWKDKQSYDQKAKELAQMFEENFKQFKPEASAELMNAAPVV